MKPVIKETGSSYFFSNVNNKKTHQASNWNMFFNGKKGTADFLFDNNGKIKKKHLPWNPFSKKQKRKRKQKTIKNH